MLVLKRTLTRGRSAAGVIFWTKTPAATSRQDKRTAVHAIRPHSSSASQHESQLFPELNESTRRSVLLGGLATAALLGLIWAYVSSSRRRRAEIPDDVASLCAEAAALRESAPLSAGSKYSAAYARCKAIGASPEVTLEVLIQLADAQLDGRQAVRARASYETALALVVRLRTLRSPGEALVFDLPRKHAAILTRLSDLASAEASTSPEALRHGRAALQVLEDAFAPIAAAALGGEFACGSTSSTYRAAPGAPRLSCRLQRHILSDYAGVHYNLARLLLDRDGDAIPTTPAVDVRGAAVEAAAVPPNAWASEALTHAFNAAVLAAVARHSCCQELMSALGGKGGAPSAPRTLLEELGREAKAPLALAHLSGPDPAPDAAVNDSLDTSMGCLLPLASPVTLPPRRHHFCGLDGNTAISRLDALRLSHPLPPGLGADDLRRGKGTVPPNALQALEELLVLDDLSAEASRLWWDLAHGDSP